MGVDIMLLSLIPSYEHDSKSTNANKACHVPSPGHAFKGCNIGISTFEVVLQHYIGGCGMFLMDSAVETLYFSTKVQKKRSRMFRPPCSLPHSSELS